MKTKNKNQLMGFLLIFVFFTLGVNGVWSAQDGPQGEYVPNQIIVKFKPPAGNLIRAKLDSKLRVVDSETSIPSIDSLNRKFQVKEIQPVFQGLHGRMRKTGKPAVALFEEIQSKYPKRTQRAPKPVRVPDIENIYCLKTQGNVDVSEMMAAYKSDTNVVYAEPDYIVKSQFVPNDPYYDSSGAWGQDYGDLWGLKNIHAADAWDWSHGEGVWVAVVDTGIDYAHEDIADNIWINEGEIPGNGIDDDGNGFVDDDKGWDFAVVAGGNPAGDNNPTDDHGHGTHVAGTIAAVGNNGIGIIGVAPQAKTMAVRMMGSGGTGQLDWAAAALGYAADNGAEVINNSWVSPSSSYIYEAVRYAYSLGCVIVCAAGNASANVQGTYPAAFKEAIAVGASDHLDEKADFSNWGYKLDVVAPGGESGLSPSSRSILSLRAEGTDAYGDGVSFVGTDYYRAKGTSMAAPHVSGIAALILAKHPTFSNENVRQVLWASAEDVNNGIYPGPDPMIGHGRVNAYKAVQIESLPDLYIKHPGIVSRLDTTVPLRGSASGEGFDHYDLYYCKVEGEQQSEWKPIVTGVVTPVVDGILGNWNVGLLEAGEYLLRLDFVRSDGIVFRYYVEEVNADFDRFVQITADEYVEEGLRTHGDWITWSRDGYFPLWFYNVKTGEIREVPRPDIGLTWTNLSDRYAVWGESYSRPPYDRSIYVYDLQLGTRRKIAAYHYGQIGSPVISDDNKVAWFRSSDYGQPWEIHVYNLATDACYKIETDQTEVLQHSLRVSGSHLAWQRGPRIYVCDLVSGTIRMIYEGPRRLQDVCISGDKVLWIQYDENVDHDLSIYMYDLSTSEVSPLVADSLPRMHLNVDGNVVVYEKIVEVNEPRSNLCMFHLLTKKETVLTGTNARNPFIHDGRIVWQYRRGQTGNWDVCMYELSHRAAIEVVSVPERIEIGQPIQLTARVTNTGGVTWTKDVFYCRPHAYLPDGTYVRDLNCSGFVLPKDVAPGETVTVNLNIPTGEGTQLTQTGPHRIGVDMVHERVKWFRNEVRVGVSVEPLSHRATIKVLSYTNPVPFGQPISVEVRVKNTGTVTWTRDVFRCRPHAIRPDGTYVRDVPGSGYALPKAVAPGESVKMFLRIPTGKRTPLNQTGSYRIIVDMIHEGVQWFGNEVPFQVRVRK